MKTIILTLILAIFLVSTASALTINIQAPDSFSLGEQMYFNYSITSDTNQQITFIPHIMCLNAPVALLNQQTINLQANVPYSNTYTDMIVNEQFEPQTCQAYIRVISPVQQTISKNFTISTLPSFSFNIKLDKTVFLKNEDISLNYNSSVQNPSIIATMTSPSGKITNIKIPSKINLNEIGTYTIDVKAGKEGYKTVEKTKQFAVIKENADIAMASQMKIPPGARRGSLLWLWILIEIVIILAVVVLIVYKKKVKK